MCETWLILSSNEESETQQKGKKNMFKKNTLKIIIDLNNAIKVLQNEILRHNQMR